MSLRFFDRLARMVRADAHGVVAALEDRSLLLEQHLREAELAFAAKKARADALLDEETRLSRAGQAEREQAAALDEDVTLALRGGKEDLARFALRRLLASRRRGAAWEAERSRVGEERQRLAEQLASQERSLDDLRERVRAHRERTAARLDAQQAPERAYVIADEEVELELLRRRGEEGGVS